MEVVEEGWIKLDTQEDYNRIIHLVRDIAPSAQPEQKIGKWVEHERAEEVDGFLISNYECSYCHSWERKKSYYCPDCGAKMEGNND